MSMQNNNQDIVRTKAKELYRHLRRDLDDKIDSLENVISQRNYSLKNMKEKML
jgi:hypothetical protein